jgi:hypothetical protein
MHFQVIADPGFLKSDILELTWESDTDAYVLYARSKEALDIYLNDDDAEIRKGDRYYYWTPTHWDALDLEFRAFINSTL